MSDSDQESELHCVKTRLVEGGLKEISPTGLAKRKTKAGWPESSAGGGTTNCSLTEALQYKCQPFLGKL